MFREFFCAAQLRRRLLAYVGLLVLCSMGFMLALLDAFVNTWYGQFYDLGGDAANVIMAANLSSSNMTAVLEARDEGLAEVARLMWSFCIVVFPAQIFSPLMEFVNQHFAFTWRLCLMEAYIMRWEASGCELEGASQRIHEDTQRFATSLQRGTTTLLQSLLKLLVFIPRLLVLGASMPRPSYLPRSLPFLGHDDWILTTAVACAAIGYGVALYVARHLVQLDVNNQKVEARLRKRLVIAEGDAEGFGGSSSSSGGGGGGGGGSGGGGSGGGGGSEGNEANGETGSRNGTKFPTVGGCMDGAAAGGGSGASASASAAAATAAGGSAGRNPSGWLRAAGASGAGSGRPPPPLAPNEARSASGYRPLWSDLTSNYSSLYFNFLGFNAWVSFWLQVPYILPFALCAPQLFSIEHPIEMGLLVQISDAFSQVTAALSTGTSSWADVNEFRSVVRRLREFEALLDEAEAAAGMGGSARGHAAAEGGSSSTALL
jgi:ABC-type long-subunit fatty acid transport system fused permease/ATPase subunit